MMIRRDFDVFICTHATVGGSLPAVGAACAGLESAESVIPLSG